MYIKNVTHNISFTKIFLWDKKHEWHQCDIHGHAHCCWELGQMFPDVLLDCTVVKPTSSVIPEIQVLKSVNPTGTHWLHLDNWKKGTCLLFSFFFLFQNSNLRFNSFKTHFDHEVLRILFLHPLEKRGGSVIPFLFIIKKPINPIAGLSVHFFSRDPNFSWFHVLFLWVASCPKCPTLLGKLFYLTKFISFFSLTAPTLTFLSLFCDSYFNTLMH